MIAIPYERRDSTAARWSRRVAGFALVLLVVSGLSHRFQLIETVPFLWVLGLVGGLALAAILLALQGFSRLWRFGDRGGRDAGFAVLLALIVLSPFFVSAYRFVAFPELNDISTDLATPPEFVAAPDNRTAAMNSVAPIGPGAAEAQAEHYPFLIGRRYPVPLDRVTDEVIAIFGDYGWPVTAARRAPNEFAEAFVEGVAYTTMLGFADDVVVRLIDEGESTYVDMRSASRFGGHDLGENAARIRDFLAELDRRLAGVVGE